MTCWSKAWREGEARTEISPAGNMGPEIFLVSPAAAAAEGACQPHDAAVSATHFCGLASSDERPPIMFITIVYKVKRPRSKARCNISPRAPCLPPPQCCAPAKPLRSHAHASWPSPRPCQCQCPRPSHTGSCSRAAATAVVRPAPPGTIHPSHYPRSINRSSRAAVALCALVRPAPPRTAFHQCVTW